MLKVFKYLKNSSFIIFIIILLLAGQASCELSLPTYTSNIINIGSNAILYFFNLFFFIFIPLVVIFYYYYIIT